MSIRVKLVLLVCLMTILPAGMVGVLAYTLSRAALSEKVKGEFQARQELIKLDLTNRLGELAKNADAWTSAPVMADIKISDNDMRIATFLVNTKKSYPILRDLTILDVKGKIVATTNQGYDEKTTPSLKEIYPLDGVAAGKPASMIGVKPQQNYLALPIHDVVSKDGSVAGVLLAEIDSQVIDKSVHTANDGKAEGEQVGVLLTTKGETVSSLAAGSSEVSYQSLAAGASDVPDGFTKAAVGGADFVVMSDEMRDVLPGISSALRLTVLQPASVAYAAVARLALYVFMLSSGLVIAFVTAGFLFARSLSRPILSLRQLSEDIINSQNLSKRITVTSADEIGSLGTSFNRLLQMVQASQEKLEEYSKGLEVKVSERTKAIRTILDHVSFGLLICDADLRVQAGYSKSCNQIMDCGDRSLEKTTLPELLQLDHRKAENFGLLYQQIFDPDFLLGDLAVDQLPSRFQLESKSIGLTGSVINDDKGKANGVLFCIADISNLVQAEEEIEKNRGLIKMLSNRDSFRQFVQDVKVGFERTYESYQAKNESLLRRELHTLKGNMGVYGLSAIAGQIHVLEDETVIKQPDIKRIEDAFKSFLDEHQDLLGVTYGVATDDSFVIPGKLVDHVETKAGALADANELRNVFTDFFRMIRLKRARTVFGPIEESFSQLATRLGKQAKLVVNGADTLVPNGAIGVFKSLNHLLRNALDHGIEAPAERGAKDETGTIMLSVTDDGHALKIEVRDDGRGISRKPLADKAKAKGIVTDAQLVKMSDEEVYNLIFLEGVSTAQSVTDVSGRGVGMSAVKAAVEEAGGTIRIASQPGKGTIFTIEVPKATSCAWRPAQLAMAN